MYKHRCTGYDGEQLVYPQYPTFVIAGAQKTGTTSLLSYFAKHPLIAKPALHEPHFFDKRIHSMLREAFARYPTERITRNETWCHIGHEYYKLLVDPDATRSYPYSFEKTPSYLHRFTAPRNLRKTCPWIPKVIITLRNPVDRAYSNYHMGNQRLKFFANETGNNQTFPFEHYIKEEIDMMRSWRMTTAPPFPDDNGTTPILMPTWDHPGHESHWTNLSGILFNENDNPHHGLLLRKGIYAPQLRRWLKFYPRDSIMVLDYRELQQNTSDVYFRILDFAGIPHDQPEHSFRAKRSSDYEPMSNTTRAYLEAFFAPYNAELQDLLGEEWKGAWTSDW